MKNNENKNKKEKVLICRPFITVKGGKRIFASSYGKEAFCFYVDKDKLRKK